MAFIETPRFPDTLSYSSSGGPEYLTGIAVLQSGHEQRRSVWATPRHMYNASYGIKLIEDFEIIRDFFHAMKGRFHGFRFKDWNDFTSAADDLGVPTNVDQEIGIGDGIEVDFQLRKNYTVGTETLQRPVTKPVAGTTIVAVDGVPQILTTDYTIDETTGIITFVTPPASLEVVTAGFEFDVPCRFDIDKLTVNADTWGIRSSDIPIVEIRSP